MAKKEDHMALCPEKDPWSGHPDLLRKKLKVSDLAPIGEDLWKEPLVEFDQMDYFLYDDSDRIATPEVYEGGKQGYWRDPEWKRNSEETTHLQMLLKIAAKADTASCAVSYEETVFLLQQFGLWLSYREYSSDRNPEIFEDPLNRGDPLGNVRMIHKRLRSEDQGLCNSFGKFLVYAVQQLNLLRKKQVASFDDWDAILPLIEAYDDTASEDILAAKKRIVELRKANNQLDRRNIALAARLVKMEDRLAKVKLHYLQKELKFGDQIAAIRSSLESLHLEDLVKQQSTLNSCSGESALPKSHPRKMEDGGNQSSQLNGFEW